MVSPTGRWLTGGADEAESSADFDFAAAVACYGMILRDSPHKADSSFDRVLELVRQSIEQMPETLELQIAQRREFVSLVEKTRDLRTRVH